MDKKKMVPMAAGLFSLRGEHGEKWIACCECAKGPNGENAGKCLTCKTNGKKMPMPGCEKGLLCAKAQEKIMEDYRAHLIIESMVTIKGSMTACNNMHVSALVTMYGQPFIDWMNKWHPQMAAMAHEASLELAALVNLHVTEMRKVGEVETGGGKHDH